MNAVPRVWIEENFQEFSPESERELRTELHTEKIGNGLFRLHAEVRNVSNRTRKIKLILEAETLFRPDHYLIPCILYNGNDYGNLDSPRGLLRDGTPWVFAYDREGIPSCTITEDASHVFAMFASDESPETLRSSCSLIRNGDGTYRHRIFYPVTEAPVTYANKTAWKSDTTNGSNLHRGMFSEPSAACMRERPAGKITDSPMCSMPHGMF